MGKVSTAYFQATRGRCEPGKEALPKATLESPSEACSRRSWPVFRRYRTEWTSFVAESTRVVPREQQLSSLFWGRGLFYLQICTNKSM